MRLSKQPKGRVGISAFAGEFSRRGLKRSETDRRWPRGCRRFRDQPGPYNRGRTMPLEPWNLWNLWNPIHGSRRRPGSTTENAFAGEVTAMKRAVTANRFFA